MNNKPEIIDAGRPGRRSGIRRLFYTAPTHDPKTDSVSGGGRWRDNRSWAEIKNQLRLTVKRAPEVVIQVKGSRRAMDDDRAAMAGVLRYMKYISRNGELQLSNELAEAIVGLDALQDIHATWDLDMQRTRSEKNELLHPSFNIIFSMPANTDPEKLLIAVSAVARGQFQGHQYLMALHTPETDPSDDPPAHPHVHLILRAEDNDGHRIHIRKTTLRVWREHFAAELRSLGVEANATSRAERGKSRKGLRVAEWHIQKRYEEKVRKGEPAQAPRAKAGRFLEAAQELQTGTRDEKPWELAMAVRRRDLLRTFNDNLDRLKSEGETALAADLRRFINEMPPLDSERRSIQRALLKQVEARLKAQQPAREK